MIAHYILNLFREGEKSRITISVWGCDYDEQWAGLSGDPCVAANITSYGYQSNDGNASIYHLTDCDQKKPFICYGNFSESSFQLQTSMYPLLLHSVVKIEGLKLVYFSYFSEIYKIKL